MVQWLKSIETPASYTFYFIKQEHHNISYIPVLFALECFLFEKPRVLPPSRKCGSRGPERLREGSTPGTASFARWEKMGCFALGVLNLCMRRRPWFFITSSLLCRVSETFKNETAWTPWFSANLLLFLGLHRVEKNLNVGG